MKNVSFARNAVIFCAFSALATSCYGATIYVDSSAAETTNSTASATMNIPQNTLWAAPFAGSSWVSYTQSGNPSSPGYVSPPNGTSVIFTDAFTINGNPISGTLMVMADDSASVTLNGVLLKALATTTGNTYKTCSDFSIGCTVKTAGTIDLTSNLHSGLNTLSFQVMQSAGVSYGLDYAGTINFTPTPEPGTLALLGLPLVALSLLRRKSKA